MAKPKITIIPESHTELLNIALAVIDSVRSVYEAVSSVYSGKRELAEKCESLERKLVQYKNEIMAEECREIGKGDVSTVYFETMPNGVTDRMYQDYLQGKTVIWLYDGFYGANALFEKGRSGEKDPFYRILQKEAEIHFAEKVENKPPAEGTRGVMRIGAEHTAPDGTIGNVAQMLIDKGFEVEVVKTKDYRSQIEKDLIELGLDLDSIRTSPIFQV